MAGAVTAGCGASATGPGPEPTPTPKPISRHPVTGVVYYDENGDGLLGDGERVRMPGVNVVLGDRFGQSGGDGRFVVADAEDGTLQAWAQVESLPPFFEGGSVVGVAVPPPGGFELLFPVRLPIGWNRPNVYMAFGDSITVGDGSGGGRGYRDELASLLRATWGAGSVVNEGVRSTRSNQGAERIGDSLSRVRPAYTLIHYGTNDWNGYSCRWVPACFTVESLRSMIGSAKSVGSVPVVGTIIPVNPAEEDHMAYERNAWVVETNDRIRPMVRQEGAVLADLHAAFLAEARDHLDELFADHVHPNDRGYDVMAREFARAITTPRGASSSR